MSARYTVIDGEVIAQERGGVRHQLVPDPLGSTIALYDNAGTKTDSFEYWPYGESAGRTGTTVAKFQYIGSYGYYQTSATKIYIRARYQDSIKGIWINEDPIGFDSGDVNFYRYVTNNPTSATDASGLELANPCSGKSGAECWKCKNRLFIARGSSPKHACEMANVLCSMGYFVNCNGMSEVGGGGAIGGWWPFKPKPGFKMPPEPPCPQRPLTLDACVALCDMFNPIGSTIHFCRAACKRIKWTTCNSLFDTCAGRCGTGNEQGCKWCLGFYDSLCLGE